MNRHTTDTETTILNEGFEQFMSNGIRSFTVESLAGRLGMSKKTIYKFFPTKEKLISAIMRAMTSRVRKQFEEIIANEPNAALQFIKVMNMIVGFLSRISVDKMSELKTRYPTIWRYVEDFRKERLENFSSILARGQEQGLVREDINIRHVSVLYIEIINRVIQPEYFIENDVNIGDTLHVFIKIFSRGLFTDQGLTIIEEAK